jgi:hypothetical protein
LTLGRRVGICNCLPVPLLVPFVLYCIYASHDAGEEAGFEEDTWGSVLPSCCCCTTCNRGLASVWLAEGGTLPYWSKHDLAYSRAWFVLECMHIESGNSSERAGNALPASSKLKLTQDKQHHHKRHPYSSHTAVLAASLHR